MLMLAAVACGGDEEIKFPDNPNQEEPKPEPKPEPEPEPTPEVEKFYKGTTMSFANYLIDFGLVYRENGEVTNPYKSVKAHGANIVRLQLDRVAFNEINGVTIDWQQWERVVEDDSTGRTALSFNDAFLEVSYSPSRAAETKASISHIDNINYASQR